MQRSFGERELPEIEVVVRELSRFRRHPVGAASLDRACGNFRALASRLRAMGMAEMEVTATVLGIFGRYQAVLSQTAAGRLDA